MYIDVGRYNKMKTNMYYIITFLFLQNKICEYLYIFFLKIIFLDAKRKVGIQSTILLITLYYFELDLGHLLTRVTMVQWNLAWNWFLTMLLVAGYVGKHMYGLSFWYCLSGAIMMIITFDRLFHIWPFILKKLLQW